MTGKRDTLPSPPLTPNRNNMLQYLHQQWITNGAKLPAKGRIAEIKRNIISADNEIDRLLTKLAQARQHRHEISCMAVSEIGAKNALSINDETYIVTSRGGLLFYRRSGIKKGI